MGYKHDDRCLDKVHDNEPIFVLRAQDKLAPEVIRYWAKRAQECGKPDAEKLAEAYNCALLMEQWPVRKYPD